jgi:hypothetical protein
MKFVRILLTQKLSIPIIRKQKEKLRKENLKISENVEFLTSPSKTTIRLSALPSAASAYP